MFVICTIARVMKGALGYQSTRMRTVFEGSEDECVAFIKNQAKDCLNVFMETDLRVCVTARMDEYAYTCIVVEDFHVPDVIHSTTYELSSFRF